MIENIGRIVSRGPRIAGLYIPLGDALPLGIYDIRRVLGELTFKHAGPPAMRLEQFTGLDLEGLFSHRPLCIMTQEEIDSLHA